MDLDNHRNVLKFEKSYEKLLLLLDHNNNNTQYSMLHSPTADGRHIVCDRLVWRKEKWMCVRSNDAPSLSIGCMVCRISRVLHIIVYAVRAGLPSCQIKTSWARTLPHVCERCESNHAMQCTRDSSHKNNKSKKCWQKKKKRENNNIFFCIKSNVSHYSSTYETTECALTMPRL